MTNYRIGPHRTASDLNWAPGPRNSPPRGSVRVRTPPRGSGIRLMPVLKCWPRWSVRSQGDWLCVCVIKTRTFWGANESLWLLCGHFEVQVLSSDPMWSDVLRCGPMRYLVTPAWRAILRVVETVAVTQRHSRSFDRWERRIKFLLVFLVS